MKTIAGYPRDEDVRGATYVETDGQLTRIYFKDDEPPAGQPLPALAGAPADNPDGGTDGQD